MTDVLGLLREFWGWEGMKLKPLGGGMNSETWLVEHGSSTFVVKQVPSPQVDELLAGCEIAETLAASGIVTGRPVPTADGRLVVREHGLALLQHIPGRELEGDTAEEQVWIGATLANVHNAGHPSPGPSPSTFMTDWLSPQLPGVQAQTWLLRAIDAIRAETDPLKVTWSVLHTDPAPEAFIYNERTRTTGLIDWAGAKRGPVLYDVASAVMYLGGPEEGSSFLNAYQRQGPLDSEEMQLLGSFRRFRWAVQGAYFAGRLASRNLVGIADQLENQRGLDHARHGLAELGFN